MSTRPSLSFSSRRAAGAALALVSLGAVVAGCGVVPAPRAGPAFETAGASVAAGTSTRVVLRFDDRLATAVLDDTAVAREFAAALPITLQLSDPMGQAKSGRLPFSRSLDVTGADRAFQTIVGELVYWPPSSTVAVIYDDLGHSVPAPGLVRLGVVDGGLDSISTAGDRFEVRIEPADAQPR